MRDGIDVLGVRVDALTQRGLEEEIVAAVERHGHSYFAYVNVHAINLACDDMEFRRFLQSASIVYCDGEGVRLGARLLGFHLPPRIALTYWIWDLCAVCADRSYSIYLLGGDEDAVRDASQNLSARFPALRIVGRHHGYFEKTGPENDLVVADINRVQPNVLVVCFGMPLQERWARDNFLNLRTNVILFGGSTIDYTAGRKKTAPRWMGRMGLEWLFRLAQEPRRLWRRYLIGNPLFLFRIIRARIVRGRKS